MTASGKKTPKAFVAPRLEGKAATAFAEIDPRVELIAAVQLLARGAICSRCQKDEYQDRIRAGFGGDHEAVALFRKMSDQDWRNCHPAIVILDFGLPPALEVVNNKEHYRTAGRGDALAEFLPQLREFARQSGFMSFFERERGSYEKFLRTIEKGFAGLNYLGPLQEYLGVDLPHRYHFVMSPLYHGENMHNVLHEGADGLFDIYSVNGHSSVASGRARLSFDRNGFLYTAWHEVSHTIIDAVTAQHGSLINPFAGLYERMANVARSRYQGPGGWLHIFDENLIRAICGRLATTRIGERFGRSSIAEEQAEGFVLVGPIAEALREYEADRARYRTIRDFYPRLLEVLERAIRRG